MKNKLKNKFPIIKGVYKTQIQVAKFIEEVSLADMKVYNTVKTITYEDYKDKYHDRHEMISKFYGDLSMKTYKIYYEKLMNLIESKNKKNELKIKKEFLIKSFKESFNISKEISDDSDLEFLKNLNQRLIYGYTQNISFYRDLNNWLRICDYEGYETISYFTARLMYSLNDYALKSNKFYNNGKDILYRGVTTDYIKVLPYERLKGRIIILSSFTSTSLNPSIAKTFIKNKKKFSAIYKITNIIKENCISSGIDIQNISAIKSEKEILFQPFSFYFVKNVTFNYEENIVFIELETISKKEILEEKIKKGKSIIYNKKLNLMLTDEK